jgi:hypothetical protein
MVQKWTDFTQSLIMKSYENMYNSKLLNRIAVQIAWLNCVRSSKIFAEWTCKYLHDHGILLEPKVAAGIFMPQSLLLK